MTLNPKYCERVMEYIECPDVYDKDESTSIFLSGGITGCPDWQHEMCELLVKTNYTILNPRRKTFAENNKNSSKDQILWEYDHLRKADIIIFWFPKESICPIALYELGAWSMTDKTIVVGVHSEYERRVDVEMQTRLVRPDVEIAYSLTELKDKLNIIRREVLLGKT